MSLIGAAEAAKELGLSARRVRQMLADGVLAGQRVGRSWVIDRDELRRLDGLRREVGRPWSPASAWVVLALADGDGIDASPVERSRARKRLAMGLDHIVGRLRVRADRRWFYVHAGVQDRLADSDAIVRAGISAAAEHGADLLIGAELEAYVRASDLDDVAARFALDDLAARPNVLLRIVDDDVWPFQPDQRYAGPAVVAVDLLESDDPRVRRAGAQLLAAR